MPFFLIETTNIDWALIAAHKRIAIGHKSQASYGEGMCSLSELQPLAIIALFVCNLCLLGYFCNIGLYIVHLSNTFGKNCQVRRVFAFVIFWISIVYLIYIVPHAMCILVSLSSSEAKHFIVFLSGARVFIIFQQLFLIFKGFILCLVTSILYSLFIYSCFWVYIPRLWSCWRPPITKHSPESPGNSLSSSTWRSVAMLGRWCVTDHC